MSLHKEDLIDKYVLPFFAKLARENSYFVNRIYDVCRLHKVVKFQELESPGAAQDGRMWFPIISFVHSYYLDSAKKCRWGSRIWKKQEFIFYSSSLLNQEIRSDYIEVLEPGEILSISYPDILDLMTSYPELHKQIQLLSAKNERHYRYHNQLMNKSAFDRVKQFEEENPVFTKVASNSIKAMHVGLTRQGYESQLKKLLFSR